MAEAIPNLVRKAGVVGAGGGGFPTHVKLSARVEHVIANGAECEPLLKVDQQLMARQADMLLAGLKAAMRATGARRGTIALKAKNAAIGDMLERRAAGDDIEVFRLADVYPSGDEQILTYDVTGRVVPEGGLPLDVGVLVQNVETLVNVAQALEGRPVTHTWLTVGGCVQRPSTLRLPVGMSMASALAEAGGPTIRDFVVLDGGPMMGKQVADLAEPVTKVTKGLIVVPASHYGTSELRQSLSSVVRRARAACCQCLECTEICPRNLLGHDLEPHRLMRALGYGLQPDVRLASQAFLCCECGLCTGAFACVMDLSPRAVYRALKPMLAAQNVKNPHRQRPDRPRPAFEYRRAPISRLMAKLGVSQLEAPAEMDEREVDVERVCIPLQQHAGVPATPVVRVGQRVKRGDLIADVAKGELGAPVHASIAGRVVALDGHIEIEA